MLSAVRPAWASWAESAIEKQPACAAASSSSGLVPLPSSKRVWNEYAELERTPLAVETVPLPDFKSPRHCADAVRFMRLWMPGMKKRCGLSWDSDNLWQIAGSKKRSSG